MNTGCITICDIISLEEKTIYDIFMSDECVICLSEQPNVLIFPCRHKCICTSCSLKIEDNCPVCRRPIEYLLRLQPKMVYDENKEKLVYKTNVYFVNMDEMKMKTHYIPMVLFLNLI